MFVKKFVLAGVMTVLAGTSAMACGINARVSVVGNEFPAIQSVGAGAQECSGAEVTTNLVPLALAPMPSKTSCQDASPSACATHDRVARRRLATFGRSLWVLDAAR